DQFEVDDTMLGDDVQFLSEGLELRALYYNDALAGLDLPQFVELDVMEVEPGTKGDTASGGVTTAATLATGARVDVPLFIKVGDRIRVDTTTGKYKERAG